MRRGLVVAVLALVATSLMRAQGPVPYKVGTFQQGSRTFVGVVLGDVVVDLAAADAAVPGARQTPPVADMKDLIARYDTSVRARIAEIVRTVRGASASRPAFMHPLSSLKILPPIMYPGTMLNAAVNYREHGSEMQGGASPSVQNTSGPPPGTAAPNTVSIAGIWERRAGDHRWNPYMFLKSPTSVIAEGDAIRMPRGRTQIDWECELGVVVSKPASYVPAADAAGYIFGYTLEMDISDRQARGDGRHGSDWLIAKSHDTFGPLGPFITPKEFVPNPRNLPVTFALNGTVLQEATTSLMIHDVFELVAYGSSILTLRAGDVIATGTPGGVGSARTPPIFLKAGDRTTCTYGGVGTLTNVVSGS